MIRGRRIFVVVALCSRAHFSSAKQMFFFCFPSVAAFTLFPFPYFSLFSFFFVMATRDLAFCLFATCFHFYDSISFVFSRTSVRIAFIVGQAKCKVLQFCSDWHQTLVE